jgi:hypothetical protein
MSIVLQRKPKSEASECPPKCGKGRPQPRGPGKRTIVRVQRMYFDPPDLDGRMPRTGKWTR